MTSMKPGVVRIEEGFEIELPEEAQRRFGLTEGMTLVVEIDQFGIHFYPPEETGRRRQKASE